ncbi:MAG: helicase-exonuclease AddAB subunit AddA [Ruminiclostridium sp.]|nr:helicase-exonuclease AddAB subunit AddA [Ruminiclostridium sp.]
MSAAQWTREQLEAITQKGCNLLVAAAAGAGKTAVLVERIIRKVSDFKNPIDIDSLLVVTFTNAAAAEMRERIGLALEEALEANPSSQHLQKQLTLLGKAGITTLHSFCLDVVRSNFHLIGLDPVFRIADETETTLMKLDVLEKLFEDKYEAENENAVEDFLKLAECYGGGKSDGGLQEIVLSLHEFIQSHPRPLKWLEEHTEEFNLPDGTDLCDIPLGKVIVKSVAAELNGLLAITEDALLTARKANGLGPYTICLEEDLKLLEALREVLHKAEISAAGWDDLYRAFNSFEPARLPRCGKDAHISAQEQVKAARKEVKDRLVKIIESTLNITSGEAVEEFRVLYPIFKTLAQLTAEFGDRFNEKKRERALLDFNDLEHLCLKILLTGDEPSRVALELRKKYEEILVDEYQDSNLIQEVIINTISRIETGQPNIFMVGDVKQSIYRFRQARPELFLSKYNTYPSAPGLESMRILLCKNFRSRHEIINGVNYIFKQIMSELVGELNYSDEEALNPGAVFPEPDGADLSQEDGSSKKHEICRGDSGVFLKTEEPFMCISSPCISETGESSQRSMSPWAVEVDIIDLSDRESNSDGNVGTEAEEMDENNIQQDESERLDSIQTEARIVAERIRTLVESSAFKVYDKRLKAYRKVEYKDIVILLRTTRNWSGIFSEELSLQGIPSYADRGTGYFKTVEIQTMISLLGIIDNPLQDIPLLAVLRSPIYLFSADELADMRLADRNLPFYEAVKKYSGSCSGITADKAAKFLNNLEEWRSKAMYMSTDELIWYLYTETSYYSYIGILPGGTQRQANLRMLFEKARQYEETSYRGLFNFISYIDRLKSGGGDFGSAKVLGENEDVVRIMSIHKSKGLEFPVVFVSGCGKRFNLQDMNGKILMHQDLGFGPDLVDTEKRITWPVISKQAIKYKIKQETLSEEMRILYVAFTRAREKLIITGTVKDYAKASAGWIKCAGKRGTRLHEYDMLKAGTYLEWIGPALAGLDDADSPDWHVRILHMNDAISEKNSERKSAEELLQWLLGRVRKDDTGSGVEEIKRRLEWKYTYEKACEIPAKLSVTELKRLSDIVYSDEQPAAGLQIPPPAARPAFMEATEGLNQAEKGSAMHFVMQHIDISTVRRLLEEGAGSAAVECEIRNQTAGMVKEEFLTLQQADAGDEGRIAAFFRSELGRRLLAAKAVSRETPFNIELECAEIYRDMPAETYVGEMVLLQGVIDCFFEEGEGLVLIDYKTDYVPSSGISHIKEFYGKQIGYYVKALESITSKKVLGKYIYLFYNGEIVQF